MGAGDVGGMTVADAALRSRKDALIATRDKLAVAIDEASPNMLPQIVGQFRGVLSELAELEPAGGAKETGLSDFEKRLRERESGAKASRRAASK